MASTPITLLRKKNKAIVNRLGSKAVAKQSALQQTLARLELAGQRSSSGSGPNSTVYKPLLSALPFGQVIGGTMNKNYRLSSPECPPPMGTSGAPQGCQPFAALAGGRIREDIFVEFYPDGRHVGQYLPNEPSVSLVSVSTSDLSSAPLNRAIRIQIKIVMTVRQSRVHIPARAVVGLRM